MNALQNLGLRALLIPLLICLVGTAALADEEFDAKMEAAREALNQAHFQQAAQLFAQAYETDRAHDEAAAAMYWEAFARYRLGRVSELKRAVKRLQQVRETYPDAEIVAEAEDLAARVTALLAEKGEAGAAREIRELADDEAGREEARAAALRGLARLDPDKALPILQEILTGKRKASRDLKHHAVFMLCEMEGKRGRQFLLQTLQQDLDPEIAVTIMMCLSRAEGDENLDAIIDFYKQSDDPDAKEAALIAISRHDSDRAFDLLADLASDHEADTELRAKALFAMRHQERDQEFGKVLAELIHSESDPELLEVALFSLARIEGDLPAQIFMQMLNNPATSDEMRTQVIFLAGRENLLDAPTLKKVYSDTDSREVKEQVCRVATMLDDEKAGMDLLLYIIRNEEDPELRRAVVFWIGESEDPRAADILLEVINDE